MTHSVASAQTPSPEPSSELEFPLGYTPTLQPSFAYTPLYDCVDTACLRLLFPVMADGKGVVLPQNATSQPFQRIYGRLNWLLWLGRGRLNILHIGGSHVQAGTLSHRIRTRLTAMAPQCQGSRGLLFPYRAIPSNSPADYRIEVEGQWRSTRNVFQEPTATLGLSGAAVMTDDTLAALNLTMREGLRYRFDSLLILGEGTTSDVQPIVTLTSDTTARITFRGLRRGYKPQPVGKKKKKAKTPPSPLDSCHFVLRGLLPLSYVPSSGITYTESGINGASVPSWLRCSQFESELGLLPPDLVVFGIGINDANVPPAEFDPDVFKSQYRQLIGRIRRVNPQSTFLFITNNDCWFSVGKKLRRKPNTNTPLVRQAMLDLAAEYQGAVIDVYGLMGQQRSSDRWVKAGLMQKDHIHFTTTGYQLIGDILYNAFLTDYLRFATSE